MNFFVDPSEGHDDYLMSLALLGGGGVRPKDGRGRREVACGRATT